MNSNKVLQFVDKNNISALSAIKILLTQLSIKELDDVSELSGLLKLTLEHNKTSINTNKLVPQKTHGNDMFCTFSNKSHLDMSLDELAILWGMTGKYIDSSEDSGDTVSIDTLDKELDNIRVSFRI